MEQESANDGGISDELQNLNVVDAEEEQLVDGNGDVADHQYEEQKQVDSKVTLQNSAPDPPKKNGSQGINSSLKSVETAKEQTIKNGSGVGSTGRHNVVKAATRSHSADGMKKIAKSSAKKASDAASPATPTTAETAKQSAITVSLSRRTVPHMKTGSIDASADCSSSTAAKSTMPYAAGHKKSISSGFSSRLEERAEKRKEFLKKLEEKIQAKEVEKTSWQAKSKENQDAEIKQLRKSLAFKATPLPSFYQEPGPPKVELKKIPSTRAISPKLGRLKPSTEVIATDSSAEGNATPRSTSSNLNSSKTNGGTKDNTITTPKKPVQKSVSRLPSQKSSQNPGSKILATKSTEQKQKTEKSADS